MRFLLRPPPSGTLWDPRLTTGELRVCQLLLPALLRKVHMVTHIHWFTRPSPPPSRSPQTERQTLRHAVVPLLPLRDTRSFHFFLLIFTFLPSFSFHRYRRRGLPDVILWQAGTQGMRLRFDWRKELQKMNDWRSVGLCDRAASGGECECVRVCVCVRV